MLSCVVLIVILTILVTQSVPLISDRGTIICRPLLLSAGTFLQCFNFYRYKNFQIITPISQKQRGSEQREQLQGLIEFIHPVQSIVLCFH